MDFDRFCYDFDILGSDFDILGILGIWDKRAVFVFLLSLSFIFLVNFAESYFFSFWSAQNQKTNKQQQQTRSLVDRGGGIWDFQHCIVITRGQEERIPKTASVVGKKTIYQGCRCGRPGSLVAEGSVSPTQRRWR